MKWKITKEMAGIQVKEFLRVEGRFSKRLIIKAKSEAGKILVNDEKKSVRYILKEKDLLEIILPPEQPAVGMVSENIPLDIEYEDAHLLVINKPAGIATIPSRHHPTGTIANGLLYYYEGNGIEATVHVVTRLDRDTSGLMIVAKNQHCHSLFSRAQRANEMERKYKAIVTGKISTLEGIIQQPIGRHPDSIIERVVRKDGQRAITHFSIKERYENATLVKVVLETGRTHQIRVHFASIGHPLVGDSLYGDKSSEINRQALHCSEVVFHHPYTGEKIQLNASLPSDMKDLIVKR